MIDLDKIEQQCKGAIENGYGHLPVLECGNAVKLMEVISRLRSAESEIDELLSMLRQAGKDAARYRELRDAESETCLEFINAKARIASPEWLDGMVDEYMQCK